MRKVTEEPGGVVTVEHPTFSAVQLLASPVQVVDAEPEYRAAPMLGEHTNQILREYASYTAKRIEELRRGGAI